MRGLGARLRLLLSLLFMILLFGVGVVALAQDECPSYVFDVLGEVDQTCSGVGRNQACYGNTNLSAEFWEAVDDDTFTTPADTVNISALRQIQGAPLNLDNQDWGVGVLRLQANIPGTLPGQNVTFLMVGDVNVESAVPPDQIAEPVEPVDVTTTGNANLRSGPSTNFGVAGSLGGGITVPAIGRNAAGDWIQILYEEVQRVWVASFLISAEGDLNSLPDVTGTPLYGPMQSFQLTSNITEPSCQGAPVSHVLVNSPEGIDVEFTVNGVNFSIGSLGAMRMENDNSLMTVTTFDGDFVLGALGFDITLLPGFEVDIPLQQGPNGLEPAQAPQNFRPYDPDMWSWYQDQTSSLVEIEDFQLPPEPVIVEQSADNPVGAAGAALGTGDVQVTLTWNNLADMDLAVTDPTGNTTYYANRSSASGGQLDIDSNYPCGQNTFQVENIFWPTGTAPRGSYTVNVNQYSNCAAGNANWTLTVRIGGAVVMQQTGTGGSSNFSFSY